MKILHYLLIGIVAIGISFTTVDDECQGSRLDIKTLSDVDAKSKMKYKARSSSIKKLAAIFPKTKITSTTPRQPQERKVYSVICKVPAYRAETDGTYKLILMDTKDSSLIMTAEIPNIECDIIADCAQLNQVVFAHNDFYAQFKLPHGRMQPGIYKVTGVFFFNENLAQVGMPSNGAELYPILGIEKIK